MENRYASGEEPQVNDIVDYSGDVGLAASTNCTVVAVRSIHEKQLRLRSQIESEWFAHARECTLKNRAPAASADGGEKAGERAPFEVGQRVRSLALGRVGVVEKCYRPLSPTTWQVEAKTDGGGMFDVPAADCELVPATEQGGGDCIEFDAAVDAFARNFVHDLHEGYVITGHRLPLDEVPAMRTKVAGYVQSAFGKLRCLTAQLAAYETKVAGLEKQHADDILEINRLNGLIRRDREGHSSDVQRDAERIRILTADRDRLQSALTAANAAASELRRVLEAVKITQYETEHWRVEIAGHGFVRKNRVDGDFATWIRDRLNALLVTPAALQNSTGGRSLETVLRDVAEWQDATFPHATPETCIAHLRKEIVELSETPRDPEELADCAMLIHSAARKAGVDLAAAIDAKLAKNRTRKWGKPNAEGFVEHVRDPQTPAEAEHESLSREAFGITLDVIRTLSNIGPSGSVDVAVGDPPCNPLNNDSHNEARALHRIVRAMHDGECPRCHTLFSSEDMLIYDSANANLPVSHECPNCGFAISAEESAAVIREFGDFMEKNLAIFEAWRAKRQPAPHADEGGKS